MTRRQSSVTIREVAKEAGVSVATVSRFINRNAPVSEEVAERLEQVMSDLRYAPDAAARHLASRKTHLLGLLLTNIHNDFYVLLLNGIESVVRQRDYNLLLSMYQASPAPLPPTGAHTSAGVTTYANTLSDDPLIPPPETSFPTMSTHRTTPTAP